MAASLSVEEMDDYALPEGGVEEVFASKFLTDACMFARLCRYAYVPKTIGVHFNRGRPAEFNVLLGSTADGPRVRTLVAPRISDDDEDD
jgi:hypothetical protein